MRPDILFQCEPACLLHVYVHIYLCICIQICLYMYIYTHIKRYVYMYIYRYIYIYMYMYLGGETARTLRRTARELHCDGSASSESVAVSKNAEIGKVPVVGAPKDYINIRILQTIVSRALLVLGLRTRL